MPAEPSTIAVLLKRWSAGDKDAFDELLTHMYRDIHAIAVRELRDERFLTISPTALVHEAYLRMAELKDMQWNDRSHFLSMAARVTRQALVDEARRRRADKRDGGTPVTLSDANLGGVDAGFDALDVDALLTELKQYDAIAADVVSLRVFGGLSVEDAATALELSVATVNRRWVVGKAWLVRELARRTDTGAAPAPERG
jgi:RNA polymerase sigma-70 factor, ECF subfamily